METVKRFIKDPKLLTFLISFKVLILATGLAINGQSPRENRVRPERLDEQHKVNVYINGPVVFEDSKEGLFAIRVDRAFEMPSNESLIFTDERGNPTTVAATDNAGMTGTYTSSQGLKGDAVWGTRNNWVYLSGIKDNIPIAFGIFDHPENKGFPSLRSREGK